MKFSQKELEKKEIDIFSILRRQFSVWIMSSFNNEKSSKHDSDLSNVDNPQTLYALSKYGELVMILSQLVEISENDALKIVEATGMDKHVIWWVMRQKRTCKYKDIQPKDENELQCIRGNGSISLKLTNILGMTKTLHLPESKQIEEWVVSERKVVMRGGKADRETAIRLKQERDTLKNKINDSNNDNTQLKSNK